MKLRSRAAAEGFTRIGENRGRPQNGFTKGKSAPDESGIMNFTHWRAYHLAQLHRDGIPFYELEDGSIVAEKMGRYSPKAQDLDYKEYLTKQAEKLNQCIPIPS